MINFHYLTQEEIDEVADAAITAGLANDATRMILLSGIHPGYVTALPIVPTPQLQLLSDLTNINRVERLADGTIPLLLWLKQATSITTRASRPESAVFQKYQSRVSDVSVAQSPMPDPGTISEVVKNEQIVHQDDMVDFGFLAAGAAIGRSVVRIRVPEFENGVPVKTSADKPRYHLGTGWLITPDLIVTNHHVVNARTPAKPADPAAAPIQPIASNDDLLLQTSQAIITFDFDLDTDAGTDVNASNLEAWDSLQHLDFAILRLAGKQDRRPLPCANALITHSDSNYVPVNIIQHPFGGAKRAAFRNNLVTAADATTIRYFTDTEQGSSGAPVCNDAWRVVALHRGSVPVKGVQFQGRDTAVVNLGTQIKAIFDHVQANTPALWEEIKPA